MLGAGALFIAVVPLTSFLAQPNGLLEKAVNALCTGVAWIGSAGSNSKVSQTSKIAALSTLYICMTYPVTGAASAAGVVSTLRITHLGYRSRYHDLVLRHALFIC